MAKHLTNKDIDVIVRLIDGWEGKLTWDALCEKVETALYFRPTRQTLYAQARVQSAFAAKKSQAKLGVQPTKRPQSLAIAQQRIHRLENENWRLKAENDRLLERFIRWQYNAQKRGVSQAVLDQPLPKVDRDSTEKAG